MGRAGGHPRGTSARLRVTAEFRFDVAFEQQAARTPDAVALRAVEGALTYADLDNRANQVASALHAAGVRAGAFVGLHLERSPDAVAALLGIHKAGGAVVPLPPAWPAERVAEILRFARLDAVIDDGATPLAAAADTRVVRLGDAWRRPAAPPSSRAGSGDQPAFVICSSGSTGTPKMIVRSHRSFHHRLRWTWEQHPFGPDDVCVQKSFVATTHAVYELFEPLLRGVAVRLVSDAALRDLTGFWSLLAAERVTRLLIVPSLLQASLDLPGFAPPPLRVLVLMGEHVGAALASRVAAVFPASTRIFSIYGSSEASSTLVADLRAPRPPDDDPPLGTPISADVRAHALDDALEPVPPGRTGTLYVAGTPLFSEYFRNPEGTAAVLTRRGAEPWYRSGDQVRVREDGSVVFAGRADGVVKVRGFRVDVGEVERWLARGPGVGQAVVVPHPDAASAATLLAFVTPADVAPAPVFAWLRAHLPAYMVPSVLVARDELPRTPSGKLDRLRLAREYRPAAAVLDAASFATETERTVAAVWSGVLDGRAVTRDASFFEVGGTSLTVFAAAHRLRAAFGLTPQQLGAATFYAHPALADLAAAIERARRGEAVAAPADDAVLVPLRRGDGSGRPPLFVVSPAGGAVGAYDKLVRALRAPCDVVGIRDPFLSGDRDPTEGFQRWVRRYTDAIRRRQPAGPYHIVAYSSAGAYGLEIAQQLRAERAAVGLLALVDPVGMDHLDPRRFGHWSLRARFSRASVRRVIRWGGELRALVPRVLRAGRTAAVNDWTLSRGQFEELAAWARTNHANIVRYAALLELNTGRPFAFADGALDAVAPSGYLDALLARVADVDPAIDAEMIGRAVVQYELQAKAQHRYRLQRYDGVVHLFEVAGPYAGLVAVQLRPYVRRLVARTVALDGLTPRVSELLRPLPEALHRHFASMRNDAFATRLAAELDALLDAP